MAAKSTLTLESQRHQRGLQTAARTFLNVMKSTDHSQEKYIGFQKDVKDLIQDHMSELKTHDVTGIMKTVLKMVRDPLCKFLHPNELSTDSSDDDLSGNIPNIEEGDIFCEFPPGTLTNKVHQTISSCLEHMEQSHTEASGSHMMCKEVSPHDTIRSFQTCSTIDDPPHHHNKGTMRSTHQTQ